MTERAEIWWDTSDPGNHGLAYRIVSRDEDGHIAHEESGPIDGLEDLRKLVPNDPERRAAFAAELIDVLELICAHRLSAEDRQRLQALLDAIRQILT